MTDLIATAKCGLLDSLFLATFRLPMMPIVVAVTAFAIAHGVGRLLAHVLAIRPIRIDALWPGARLVLAAILTLFGAAVVLRGLAYPVFLLRMVKDAYYCSYFEAGHDLQTVHWIVFLLMFSAHVFCIVVFDHRRIGRLESAALKGALIATYFMLGIAGYLMAIALDATLVPLTILFILPFAYFGIGILARHR